MLNYQNNRNGGCNDPAASAMRDDPAPAMAPGTPRANPDPVARRWRHLASQVAFKNNLALWLDVFVPVLTGALLLGAVTILLLRSSGLAPHVLIYVLLGLTALSGLAALIARRDSFMTTAGGFVHLDYRLRLNNRLTAAHHGIGSWPPLPAQGNVRDGLRWSVPRLILPVGASALLFAASLLIPINVLTADDTPVQEPVEWNETREILDRLEEEQLVDSQVLEQFEAKLDELQKKARDEWYEHATLEATDALQSNLEKGMVDLREGLKDARNALNSAIEGQGELTKPTIEKLESQMQEALQMMGAGMLPANDALMEALQNVDLSQPGQTLTEEQMQQLMEQLQQGGETLRDCLGQSQQGEQELPDIEGLSGDREGENGDGSCQGQGQGEGDGTGQGGINRGPGVAPLKLDQETDLNAGQTEKLDGNGADPALGDLLGEVAMDPQGDEEEYGGLQQGGGFAGGGDGGEAVLRHQLEVEEREVIRRYFE